MLMRLSQKSTSDNRYVYLNSITRICVAGYLFEQSVHARKIFKKCPSQNYTGVLCSCILML